MTDRFVTVPDSLELPAAVKVPVARLHDSTVAGRALLTGADAAAQCTSLGLGDAAQHAHGDYATAEQGAKADASDVAALTLTAPLALTVPAGFPAGQVYRVVFTQDGTGGHTVTYDGDPVVVALTAGASTTVELHPVGAGYVVRYPSSAPAAKATDAVLAASQSTAPLGANATDGTGWTLGDGWSGSYASGFTHATGSTAALSWAASALPAGRYLVSFTVSTAIPAAADLTVRLGDAADAYIYNGGAAGSRRAVGFRTTAPGPLVFTPGTTFAGTITAVSVQAVSDAYPPALVVRDSDGATATEMRAASLARESVLLGSRAGQYDTAGTENVAVGFDALAGNISGFWNTAVGWGALRSNTNGSRNVALGEKALVSNTSGYRNVALGQSVLVLNKTGQGNVAIGADSMLMNSSGSKNISIGLSALGSNAAGGSNIAIGEYAMNGAETSSNIGIGRYALYGTEGVANIGIGDQSGRYGIGGGYNTSIGGSSLLYPVTGADNTAIGYEAGRGKTTSGANFNRATLIGRAAGRRLQDAADDNTAIGHTALGICDGGIRNTALGASAGASATGGVINSNVLIGYRAGVSLVTGGDNNTLLGTSAGYGLTTGNNNILIGKDAAAPTASSVSRLNIGGTIYGDLATDHVGIGVESMTAVLHLKAGTSEAGSAPLKLTAGSLLTTPEAGAIEFDGTNLYFTTAAGARKTLAVVA